MLAEAKAFQALERKRKKGARQQSDQDKRRQRTRNQTERCRGNRRPTERVPVPLLERNYICKGMTFIHGRSEDCTKSQADLFEVSPAQPSTEKCLGAAPAQPAHRSPPTPQAHCPTWPCPRLRPGCCPSWRGPARHRQGPPWCRGRGSAAPLLCAPPASAAPGREQRAVAGPGQPQAPPPGAPRSGCWCPK